jgi:hypothetical protein
MSSSHIPDTRDRKRIVRLKLNRLSNDIAVEVERRRKAAFARSAELGSSIYELVAEAECWAMKALGSAAIAAVIDSLPPGVPATQDDLKTFAEEILGFAKPLVDGEARAWVDRVMKRLRAAGSGDAGSERCLRERAETHAALALSDLQTQAELALDRWLVGQTKGAPVSAPKRRKRRPQRRKPKPLTGQQTKALHLFGEHKGNVAAVARAMKVDHSTAQQHIDAGFTKLGTSQSEYLKRTKTRNLAHDNRGQVTHAAPDERPDPDK